MPRSNIAALAALLLVAGLLPAAATEHLSLGVSPQDPFSTSGQPAPFGSTVKTIGQTFKTPDKKSTELTAFAFYMSRAKPAPRFVIPQVFMWDPLNRKVKGDAVFKGDPVDVSAVAEDRDNAAIVIETGGVNLKPDTPYIAVFTTLGAGNSGLWSPLTSVNVQLIDTGYGEGQFLVSNADSLDGPVWTDGNGRSLTFWMAFEEPIAALVNGAAVTTKTPQVAAKPGQTRALKFTVTNSGSSVISNAQFVVTPPAGVTLVRASVAPKDKSTGFGTPATSWTQPVNLDVGKSRIYTYKVRVDRCSPAGDLVLATAVGAVTGPSITLKVTAANKTPWGC